MTWPFPIGIRPQATPSQAFFAKTAAWLTFGSAVSIILSIWLSQMLLWTAVAALLLSGEPLRLPRIKLPLALFMLGTLISFCFSGEFAHGLPQIKKFLVFLMLLVVFSTLRSAAAARSIFLVWAVLGALAGLLGIVQFIIKLQEARAAGVSFGSYYITERITGFMSHWNTFSEEEMVILLMLCAFLFFAPVTRRIWIWVLCTGLLGIAVVLAETRGVWFASAFGILYLIWFWRPKLILLVPVLVAAIWFAPVVGQRVRSVLRPAQSDSNLFHLIVWRTGIAMAEQHPFLGLGPDGPKFHFQEYIPKDIPRPLPEGFYQHVHNVYLQYAADRGIPTALIMIWLLLQVVIDCVRGLRSHPTGRSTARFLLHGAIAVVLATMIDGFVEYNLGDSEFLTMFLVVVACSYLALQPHLIEDQAPLSGTLEPGPPTP